MASPDGPEGDLAARVRPIVRLDETVVNRIAAGEVIARPANAIKELLENCLDAGATSVKITVKEGGVKLLQIQDNGCGIRKADLPILCERFTTSKIRKFADLSSLQTYGFRGEALASISHVAHLNVTTKTRDEAVGWKAHYADGRLVAPTPGGSVDPKPSASNDGTIITAEDMFYNIPQRRKALQSASDEYHKILDVISKYAIHNEGVSITCKKSGTSVPDVATSASASTLDTIGQLYNETLRKSLVRLECGDEEGEVKYQCEGWVSNAHWHSKKSQVLIFINHRLVDCAPLKNALVQTYLPVLPRGTHPFLYVSLVIPPEHVDPNVHPNKREVRFLNEEAIVDGVVEGLAKALEESSGSRTYKVQTLLPGVSVPSSTSASSAAVASSSRGTQKVAPQKLVRTDPAARTLDALLPQASESQRASQRISKRRRTSEGTDGDPMQIDSDDDGSGRDGAVMIPESSGTPLPPNVKESACSLTSVRTLRKRVREAKHAGLETFCKKHIFVGVVDIAGGTTCLQHETKLYIVMHTAYCDELFYQLGLRQFGALPRFKLTPPPPLRKLVELGVQKEYDDNKDEVLAALGVEVAVEKICHILQSRREMLDEYFSLRFDDDGNVASIPVLLPGYRPNLEKLPLLFVRMAVACDWSDEIRCFDTFLHELAFFYIPSILPDQTDDDDDEGPGREASASLESDMKVQLKNVVWPAIKAYLEPSKGLLVRTTQVTSLPELYRVFERC